MFVFAVVFEVGLGFNSSSRSASGRVIELSFALWLKNTSCMNSVALMRNSRMMRQFLAFLQAQSQA